MTHSERCATGSPGGGPGASRKSADGLVSSAYGETDSTSRRGSTVSNSRVSEAFCVEIFPSGVVVRRSQKAPIQPPKGTLRGEIHGFSPEAARRLREFCVTQEAKGLVPWSMTGTVHRTVSATEWRAMMGRFHGVLAETKQELALHAWQLEQLLPSR